MRRGALLFVIGVVAVSGAGVRPASSGNGSVPHGRIVFEATRTTRSAGLVEMDANGTHRRRIARSYGRDIVVGIGGAYAYDRAPSGGAPHVFVVDAGRTRTVGPGRPVAFSPDGSTLVVRNPDDAWELRDGRSGALQRTFPGTDNFFGWSRAGLLWQRGTGLVVTQADGSGATPVARSVYPGGGGWEPSWSPDGSWVAYSVQPSPGAAPVLHVVHPDGSSDHALATLYSGFVWSPDGSRIAFATAQSELAFASPDGTIHPTGATVSSDPSWLGSWSPDGTRFVFPGGDGPTLAPTGWLTVIATATDATRVLSRGASALWSPDGRRLLVGTRSGVAVVAASATAARPALLDSRTTGHAWLPDGHVLVNEDERQVDEVAWRAAGGRRTHFIPYTDLEREPVWSPDGRKLAFALPSDNGRWTISVASPDGSHRHIVAHSDANGPSPSWSPDGRFLAYAGYDAIYIVPASGGRARRVTSADLPWTVAWSPDGKQLAFGDDPPGGDSDYANVVLVDLHGKHRQVVVRGEAGQNWGGIAWSPDGKTLAVARRSDEGGDPDGVPDLYLLDLRTHHKRDLGLYLCDPSFSPDGKHLAVTDQGTGTIRLIDLAGLGSVLAAGQDPSWSPG